MADHTIATGRKVIQVDHEFNGTTITQRGDGYMNATAMCKAGGKQFNDYARLDTTKAFLDELNSITVIPVDEQFQRLTQSKPGAPSTGGGTWVHPQVAYHLAQWISPVFAVKVSGWIHDMATHGYAMMPGVTLTQPPKLDDHPPTLFLIGTAVPVPKTTDEATAFIRMCSDASATPGGLAAMRALGIALPRVVEVDDAVGQRYSDASHGKPERTQAARGSYLSDAALRLFVLIQKAGPAGVAKAALSYKVKTPARPYLYAKERDAALAQLVAQSFVTVKAEFLTNPPRKATLMYRPTGRVPPGAMPSMMHEGTDAVQ